MNPLHEQPQFSKESRDKKAIRWICTAALAATLAAFLFYGV